MLSVVQAAAEWYFRLLYDYISFPKMLGSSAYFEVYVTFKYGDFQFPL